VDAKPAIRWPSKVELFGIQFSVTNYDELIDCIAAATQAGEDFVVDFVAVDTLTQAAKSPQLRNQLNTFEAVCPDGHPVRIAMNHLHGTQLHDRVCGPDATARLLRRAERDGIPVYFYGSTERVLGMLRTELEREYPELLIAGMEPSLFRPLNETEKPQLIDRINATAAKLVFIGLGSPRQSEFAGEFKGKLRGGLISIGAAFDFLAKNKKRAPAWMRDNSLEWLFRLSQEPRRLFWRYTARNLFFLSLYCQARMSRMLRKSKEPASRQSSH
jgi:exopolysaccharide biosynthesis WecB/TagA/CpsF family protein